MATSVGSIATSSSNVATPLLSAGVETTNAPLMPPLPSLAPPVPPFIVLAAAAPSSSSHPHVSLDHLYDSLWGANYKPKKKTPTGFVSSCDRNLIQSVGVQNTMNFAKVFLLRSLAILKENGQRHQETLRKVLSFETEVTK